MSTPSTVTAIHPPHHFIPTPNYHELDFRYHPSSVQSHASSKLGYSSDRSNATPILRHPGASYPRPPNDNAHLESHSSPGMPGSRKSKKTTDWGEFYKNGLPQEVIVIDSSPEPDQQPKKRPRLSPGQQPTQRPPASDKRRKAEPPTPSTSYSYHQGHLDNTPYLDDSLSATNSSRDRTDRTASALYSTAATSLDSTSSRSYRQQKAEETKVGQKRKRPARREPDEESDVEVLVQNNSAWASYVPPPQPPKKAPDVHVKLIKDKTYTSTTKYDDEDGHYIVVPNTELTEKYVITRLLGQGTFGKVVEAYDRTRKTKCAVKIIRAVPKYRDASRIELRVLSTLKQNDQYNRNKCIHLRECFDFRNHICIVTDLLSSSVFDFLKANTFTPFPSTHIQSFARQLFTSVAFLHDLNLIHTDLKPENILLVNNAYQTFTYNRAIPSSSRAIARNAKQRKVLLNPEIRLIDFGSATFDDEYHSSVVSTRHYRAPEIILNLGWSFPCDIWSIGCILVEFFTGDALFQTHDNLEHLAMMEAVCNGKIDREIIMRVRQSGRNGNRNAAASYFKPKAYSLDYPNQETPKNSRKYVKNMKRLDETIPQHTAFNKQFLDLLRRIFVYDPKKRITAKEALKHPWFKEALQDDGTEALRLKIEREKARYSAAESGRSEYRA